jgi:transmembrane sensor
MNKTQAFDFLQKFAANKHSVQEQQDFRQWLMTADEESIREVTLQYEAVINNLVVDDVPDQQLMARIEAGIDKVDNRKPAPVRRILVWVRYVAAAALLFVVCGLWFVVDRPKKKPAVQVAQTASKEILPGNNHALLTLSDGSQVVLDSTGNKNIVKDGNTVITKQQGQISYAANTAQPAATITYNTLATPRGGQYQLVLPDGSKVWLNAAASVRYPTLFAEKERRVEVTGEVYFEVRPSTSPRTGARIPFIVSVNDKVEVEVLGTHFNINAYEDEENIKTTLLEGKVKVSAIDPRLSTIDSRLLSPGEQAILSGVEGTTNYKLQTTNNIDLEEVMAWKNGFIQFKSAPLTSILRQVARWYNIDIMYEGAIPEEYLTGIVPRTAHISKVLEVLETAGTIHVEVKDKTIIVSAKKTTTPPGKK